MPPDALKLFPELPASPLTAPWPADVLNAHSGLESSYGSARRALNLDESDPIRLRYHLTRASQFMVSMVEVLGLREESPLPTTYIELIAGAVGNLVIHLRKAFKSTENQYVAIFQNNSHAF